MILGAGMSQGANRRAGRDGFPAFQAPGTSPPQTVQDAHDRYATVGDNVNGELNLEHESTGASHIRGSLSDDAKMLDQKGGDRMGVKTREGQAVEVWAEGAADAISLPVRHLGDLLALIVDGDPFSWSNTTQFGGAGYVTITYNRDPQHLDVATRDELLSIAAKLANWHHTEPTISTATP